MGVKRVLNYFLIGFIVLGIGFLFGYYGRLLVGGSTVSEKEAPPMQEAAIENIPSPTPVITPANRQEEPASAEAEVYTVPTQPPESTVKYIVKEYMGKLAVYKIEKNGETSLQSLTDIDISLLPEEDRKLISEGIEVISEEEMLQLIEDYIS